MVIKHYVRSDPIFENVHVSVCDVRMCLEKDEDEQWSLWALGWWRTFPPSAYLPFLLKGKSGQEVGT